MIKHSTFKDVIILKPSNLTNNYNPNTHFPKQHLHRLGRCTIYNARNVKQKLITKS